MTRLEIIEQLKEHFRIEELVCNHTFKAFGNKSWQFLSTEYLHTILVLRRDVLKVPMICNNYHAGLTYSQRGLRCNICQITKEKTNAGKIYLSAHCSGNGGDFSMVGMDAATARKLVKDNEDLLPYNVRMENNVSWLHIDVFDVGNGQKVNFFNP